MDLGWSHRVLGWGRGQCRKEPRPCPHRAPAQTQYRGAQGLCSYTEVVSFFAPPPTFFTFVIVVDMSKIPQKWAEQGFLSLDR